MRMTTHSSAGDPDRHADAERQAHGDQRRLQRDARAIQQAREGVAPEVVGAQPMHMGRRGQNVVVVLIENRIMGGKGRRQNRNQDQ